MGRFTNRPLPARYTSRVDEDEKSRERRRFLQALGVGALAAAGCGSSCAGPRGRASVATTAVLANRTEAARVPAPSAKPRVVVVRTRKALTTGYDADRGALRAMLAAGLLALTGEKDAARALAHYVRPGDRVGLKINGLAGRQAATHVELVDEISPSWSRPASKPASRSPSTASSGT